MRRLFAAVLLVLLAGGTAHAQQTALCPGQTGVRTIPDANYTVTTGDNCWWINLTATGVVNVHLPTPNQFFQPTYQVTLVPLNTATGVNLTVDPDPQTRQRILRETRTVAIVGASAKPARASYDIWTYLKSASDYALYLVNPTISEVEGTPVYPSLADLPVVPDLVDVFRRHEHLPSVLDDTIRVGAKTLWLQLGLWHEQVARDGEAAGLQVVMDRCLKVDHARLLG